MLVFSGQQQRQHEPRFDEEDGFDEQYFRRRPKSFCVPPGGPQGRYLPQGGPGMAPGGPQPLGIPTSGMYPDPRLQMSMGSLVEAEQQQRIMVSKTMTKFKMKKLVGPLIHQQFMCEVMLINPPF